MKKKAVSPVIATVLLISLVVVLSMIVILWFTSLTQEAITKSGGQNVEVICQSEIQFDASYSSGTLSVVNTGNTPIYRMKVKEEVGGEFSTTDVSDWPNTGLNKGKTFSSFVDYSGNDKITLIPVLLGESDSGKKSFTCDEKQGVEILI